MPRLLRLLLLCFTANLYAGERVLSSGDGQTVLLELYTSEGCSSCPPMERYLNRLKAHDALWQSYIPLAFHVDYWNYIGWVDRFASAEFAERQRAHAREGNVRSVYTPAMIVNGEAWRPGLVGRLPGPETRRSGQQPSICTLPCWAWGSNRASRPAKTRGEMHSMNSWWLASSRCGESMGIGAPLSRKRITGTPKRRPSPYG
jgi:hypothetical protein